MLALLFGRFAAGRFVPGSSLLDVSRDVLFLETSFLVFCSRSWILVPGAVSRYAADSCLYWMRSQVTGLGILKVFRAGVGGWSVRRIKA